MASRRRLKLAAVGVVAVLGAAGCGGKAATARQERAPLLGTWHESFTRAEYLDAGADTGEQEVPVNWGAFVLTFRPGGRYTVVKTDAPYDVQPGTYRVKGDRVTFVSQNDPGPSWPYHWSIYRRQLNLRRAAPDNPDGTVAEPTGFVVKPWLPGS